MSTKYILIALESFEDESLNIPNGGPINSIMEWKKTMIDYGCTEHAVLLNEQATYENVTLQIRDCIQSLTADDVALIVFITHGTKQISTNYETGNDIHDEVILLYDKPLLDNEIRELFNQKIEDSQIVLFLDICYANSATHSINYIGDCSNSNSKKELVFFGSSNFGSAEVFPFENGKFYAVFSKFINETLQKFKNSPISYIDLYNEVDQKVIQQTQNVQKIGLLYTDFNMVFENVFSSKEPLEITKKDIEKVLKNNYIKNGIYILEMDMNFKKLFSVKNKNKLNLK